MGCKSSVGCSDAAVERVVQVHCINDVMEVVTVDASTCIYCYYFQ